MRIAEVERVPDGRQRRLVMSWFLLVLGAANVAAEARECVTVVVGEDDAATDVLAVQQAVDDGCATVWLQGKFSFSGMSEGEPLRVITVGRSLNIVGQLDAQGRMPRIVGGQTPFLVDAPGAVVRIKGLRFVRPVSRAIQVGAVMDAAVANCAIEAVEHSTIGDPVFGVVVGGSLFDSPIHRVVVAGNTIVVGEPVEVGVILAPSSPFVDIVAIDHNEIRAKAHGIDLRSIGGSAQVDRNRITIIDSGRTGDWETNQLVDGVRCLGEGACHIVDNRIESHHPNSSGVRLQAAAGAVVDNNILELTPPDGSTPGEQSSGVQLIEDTSGDLVSWNQVGGAARTAFSVSGPPPLVPSDSVFLFNRHPGFAPSFVDMEIGEGALHTLVIGEVASISDLGTGTLVW